ncbi:hypothetical protein ALO56_200033 [Pseudomonas viridiflava]|nr:hypothetical protein ALO56_200033 [Pseudomonas viridiflava]
MGRQLFAAPIALIHHLEHARLRPSRGGIPGETGKTRVFLAHGLQPDTRGPSIHLLLVLRTLSVGRVRGRGDRFIGHHHGSGADQFGGLRAGVGIVLAVIIQAVSAALDLFFHVAGKGSGILFCDLAIRLAALSGVHRGFQVGVGLKKCPGLVRLRAALGDHAGHGNRPVQLSRSLIPFCRRRTVEQCIPLAQGLGRVEARLVDVLVAALNRRRVLSYQLAAQGAQQTFQQRLPVGLGDVAAQQLSERAGVAVLDARCSRS